MRKIVCNNCAEDWRMQYVCAPSRFTSGSIFGSPMVIFEPQDYYKELNIVVKQQAEIIELINALLHSMDIKI